MRKRRSSGGPEAMILRELSREGCPICHEVAGSDESHFFWFFNENFFEPFTLTALTRSLGFCLLHSELLTHSGGGQSQLTSVYGYLVRHVLKGLAAEAASPGTAERVTLRREGPCPACWDRQEKEARSAFWLSGILEDPPAADLYANPGLLCFPHLALVLPRVRRPTLERLLAIHDSALTDALKSVSSLATEIDDCPLERRGDLQKSLLLALQPAIGHEMDTRAYPKPDEGQSRSRERDPAAEFLSLCGESACAVCLEVRRSWIEWIGWLDGAVKRRDRVEDVLPGCREHVWAVAHRGGPLLVLRAAERAVEQRINVLRTASSMLNPPVKPDRKKRLAERAREAVLGPRRRFQAARDFLMRPLRCPVCERLDIAADRALELLFALVQDRPHRAIVERGYGLCLAHLTRALALAPPADVAAILKATAAARLASLGWELDEASRKAAWQFRPEGSGTEQTAWRRALVRFAGSLSATWS